MVFTGLTLGDGFAVGSAHLGRLVDVGSTAHDDRAVVRALPRLPSDPTRPGPSRRCAPKRSAVAALIAFIDVPIVYFSVCGGRASIRLRRCSIRSRERPTSTVRWPGHFYSGSSRSRSFIYLVVHRYRLGVLTDHEENEGLSLALKERQSEAMQ